MGTQVQLAEAIRRKVEEFRKVCAGVDEETASRAPTGKWSPKEIVSHLLGPEGIPLPSMARAFLDQDTPRFDIEPANPFFSKEREQMSFSEIVSLVTEEYGRTADFLNTLSEEQLDRKAHVPIFKDLPMGEYPTLRAFVGALADYHLAFHIDDMRETLQLLRDRP